MFNLYRNRSFNSVKIMGEFLNSITHDKAGNFIYMALPYETFMKYGKPPKISTYVANTFSNLVDGTLFGITVVGGEDNKTNVSFRARGDFDVSRIASELGGGGHKVTAAATLVGLPYEKAVEKILAVSRKYAKKIS